MDDATMAAVRVEMVPVTYTDLLSWPEDGRRYELYDGEVRELSAPFPRHQLAMLELQDTLRSYALGTGGLVLVSPIDIVFDELNVLQPDIVFFTAARRHYVELDRAIRVPPDVAIEVMSPGTAAHDRGKKLRMFERFGVPEYWILDPDHERLEAFALQRSRYVRTAEAGRSGVFQSAQLRGFACQGDSLFPWPPSGTCA